MKYSNLRHQVRAAMVMAICLVASTVALAQKQSFSGKYEGTAKNPDGPVAIRLELAEDAGKISGQLTSPHGVYKIVKGEVVDGVLTLEADNNGAKGKLTLKQKDDLLTGDFTAEGHTAAVEFKKAIADELSGEWDAVADAQGQPFPFTLIMKLEGEKVTGSSSSQLGNVQFTSGSWKDGKLTLLMEGGSGQIALMATMIDGKLAGDYDFAGQASGKWVAMKKK